MIVLALAVLCFVAFLVDLATNALPLEPLVWLLLAAVLAAVYFYFYGRRGARRV